MTSHIVFGVASFAGGFLSGVKFHIYLLGHRATKGRSDDQARRP